MIEKRIIAMTENIVAATPTERIAGPSDPNDDDALARVDQAVDVLIAAIGILNENLPKIKTVSVPQKAAVDTAKDLLDTAVAPYVADMAKALSIFDVEGA